MFGDKIKKFWKIIKKSKSILLISHIRMDPDTFWSMWALYYILESMGKNVKATNDDPAPDSFWFMWANSIVKTNIDFEKFNPDLIISLDAASLWQLWKVYSENSSFFEKNFVMIDHHVTNKWYWTHNIIDKDVSSTCELLYKIIIKLKYQKYLTPKIATLLLSWILTDTNIFYNANTTPKTLKVASELLEYKAKSREAMFNFFKKRTFNKSKMWWEALKDLKQTSDWKVIRLIIKKEKFEKTWTTDRETSWLISDFLANIDWMKVCFMLYELETGWVKASFRSNKINVSKFCKKFWWWWHKLAAWFTIIDKSIEKIEKEVIKELKKEF